MDIPWNFFSVDFRTSKTIRSTKRLSMKFVFCWFWKLQIFLRLHSELYGLSWKSHPLLILETFQHSWDFKLWYQWQYYSMIHSFKILCLLILEILNIPQAYFFYHIGEYLRCSKNVNFHLYQRHQMLSLYWNFFSADFRWFKYSDSIAISKKIMNTLRSPWNFFSADFINFIHFLWANGFSLKFLCCWFYKLLVFLRLNCDVSKTKNSTIVFP